MPRCWNKLNYSLVRKMKAIVRTSLFAPDPIVVHYHTYGIDDKDILIFRDEDGNIVRLVRQWTDAEFLEEEILCFDDQCDALEKKRGYCDC